MTTSTSTFSDSFSSGVLDVAIGSAATYGVSTLLTTIDPAGATLFVATQRVVHLALKYFFGESNGNNARKFLGEAIPFVISGGIGYYATRAAGYNFTAKVIGASLLTAQPYILAIGILATYTAFSYLCPQLTRVLSFLSQPSI